MYLKKSWFYGIFMTWCNLFCFITKLKHFPIIRPDFTDDDDDESEQEQTTDNKAVEDCPRELNGMYFECDLACWYT
jgi:hypothetical protein